jgi:hypothetical protein
LIATAAAAVRRAMPASGATSSARGLEPCRAAAGEGRFSRQSGAGEGKWRVVEVRRRSIDAQSLLVISARGGPGWRNRRTHHIPAASAGSCIPRRSSIRRSSPGKASALVPLVSAGGASFVKASCRDRVSGGPALSDCTTL